jgi:hypothetical protein
MQETLNLDQNPPLHKTSVCGEGHLSKELQKQGYQSL